MLKLIIAALPLAFVAGAALAEPACGGNGPVMPMWEVAKRFEDAGGAIQTLKVSDGCYEIYGKQGGEKVEIYYDPRTGAEIEGD
jgi:hypothetical protein